MIDYSEIKTLMSQHGFYAKDVAERLNITPQLVSRWFNGSSIPNAVDFKNLANVLNVTVDELHKKDTV